MHYDERIDPYEWVDTFNPVSESVNSFLNTHLGKGYNDAHYERLMELAEETESYNEFEIWDLGIEYLASIGEWE